MQNARVIVVGAGISGISAASRLIENGFKNLLVLEAENRIGGRVCTIPFADNRVDLGAQWCHGEKGNIVFDLVKDHKVLDISDISYPNVNFFRSTGQLLDNEKCGRLMALCLLILENSEKDLEDCKGSLGGYVVAKYEEALQTPEYADIDSDTSQQVLEYFHKFENSIEASDSWFETSGNGYLQYWECEGHPLLNWKDKGYKTVIDFITKKLPDPAAALDVESKILLNKEVANIKWTDPCQNHLVLKCSDGTSYDADHVIVTTSLGVLKENYQTLFTPSLPPLKVNAIEGLSFGTVDKIFVEFEKPFWGEDWAGFSLLWTQKDSEEIRNTPNAWLEDVFGFYKVDYQPNILCGWIGGPSARTMEKLDEKTIYDGCISLFEKFLGRKMAWTRPVKVLTSSWHSNSHFRGSYSFRSLTTEMLKTSAKHLAHPLYDSLGKPSLMFAGEATSEHYYSTVHGAMEAGQREAKRLTEYYSSKSTEISAAALLDGGNVPKEIRIYDAIVVGAGIAGLGAGKTFLEANLNFVVLEGSDRVGGRINTVEMLWKDEKVNIDAGAQWLHGKNNELFKFAESSKLIRPELSEEADGDFALEDGTKIDDFFVKKVDFVFGEILQECEQLVTKREDPNFVFPRSLEDFVQGRFKKFIDSLESEEQKILAAQLLDWHRRFQIIDNSCMNFDDISAKDWGNYSFNGESCQTHINVKDGMSTVVGRLHDELKAHIEMNKVVKLISWKKDADKDNPTYMDVLCEDGTIFRTKNLICAIPLGKLNTKQHLNLFSPPLPKSHRDVLEGIGFGTIDKIFLHFDEKWWSDDWKGIQFIWKEDPKDDSQWSRYLTGFDVIFPSPENTLLGWIGGRGAINMEKQSDAEISKECMKLLRNFLNNAKIPDPSVFYCSRWNSNELIKGAYSFTSRRTDHINGWEKVLSEPIISDHQSSKNIVALAGEHCHEKYFSTIHGAFESGIDQARKVMKLRSELKSEFNSSKL